MTIEKLKSVPNKAVLKQGRDVVSTKALADMTDKELDDILTFRGRVAQSLVNAVWEEKRIRATNSAIDQARGDQELLTEIREALMAEGKAEAVAINLTNTEAKMLEQGKRLGIL